VKRVERDTEIRLSSRLLFSSISVLSAQLPLHSFTLSTMRFLLLAFAAVLSVASAAFSQGSTSPGPLLLFPVFFGCSCVFFGCS
jgi:hypothetical protein